MRYAFLLYPHPNIRYRASVEKLSIAELRCMLAALHIDDYALSVRSVATESYLMLETAQALEPNDLAALSRHSSAMMLAEYLPDGLLRPLARDVSSSLSPELPHVLKYKGKTNPDFTLMMLHCAHAASAFFRSDVKLRVLDPMCGKGTSLFCALCGGHDAIGTDPDSAEVDECNRYFEKFLQFHRVKYQRSELQYTVQQGKPLRACRYSLPETDSRGALKLETVVTDCRKLPCCVHADSCHLAVCDFPYGVQHAPKGGGKVTSLDRLADECAAACRHALCRGGAAAFAFNTHTLSRETVEKALSNAGLHVLTEPPWNDFSHWVEQAIVRDLVIAVK